MRDDESEGVRWTSDPEGRSVHALAYHVVLVTRRRRPFFAGAAERAACERALRAAADACGCRVLRVAVHPAAVELEVQAGPQVSPQALVTRLREDAAGQLLAEFEEMRRSGAVFVRRYLVATTAVPEAAWSALEEGVPRR